MTDLREGAIGERDVSTFDEVIIAAFYCHVRDRDELEFRLLLSVEVVEKPTGLLHIAHSPADVITFLKESIDDVTSNETVDARHEDGGTGLDGDVGHGGYGKGGC